jgi:protein tyrosine phosphatase (PTP) superfamily phosphohydrolase (DUF442 family)
MKLITTLPVIFALVFSASVQAEELSDIFNYLQYSDSFASAGQPSESQLEVVRDSNFDLVVYIGFSNSRGALDNEDSIVKKLGMDYVQIPVDFDNPTVADFQAFAGVMQENAESRVLLHCQANYRASAFSFLYRVIFLGADSESARADMLGIWTPDEAWSGFIHDVLTAHGKAP